MQEIKFYPLFIKLMSFLEMLFGLQEGDSERGMISNAAKPLMMQRESIYSLMLQRECSNV